MNITLSKAGRFAYLLPYIIMPLFIMIRFQEDLTESLMFAYFLPFGIESASIILYPVTWIISLACFIICAVQSRKTGKGKVSNIVCAVITGIWLVIHIIAIIVFISNFTIMF